MWKALEVLGWQELRLGKELISIVENTDKERREHVFYKESVKFCLKMLLKDKG